MDIFVTCTGTGNVPHNFYSLWGSMISRETVRQALKTPRARFRTEPRPLRSSKNLSMLYNLWRTWFVKTVEVMLCILKDYCGNSMMYHRQSPSHQCLVWSRCLINHLLSKWMSVSLSIIPSKFLTEWWRHWKVHQIGGGLTEVYFSRSLIKTCQFIDHNKWFLKVNIFFKKKLSFGIKINI